MPIVGNIEPVGSEYKYPGDYRKTVYLAFVICCILLMLFGEP